MEYVQFDFFTFEIYDEDNHFLFKVESSDDVKFYYNMVKESNYLIVNNVVINDKIITDIMGGKFKNKKLIIRCKTVVRDIDTSDDYDMLIKIHDAEIDQYTFSHKAGNFGQYEFGEEEIIFAYPLEYDGEENFKIYFSKKDYES